MTCRQIILCKLLTVSGCALILTVAAGCGGGGATPAPSPDSPAVDGATGSQPLTPAAATDSTQPAGAAATRHGRNEIYVDDKGQKWFGQIPYDVFFDEPYAVASDSTPLTSGGTNALASSTPDSPAIPGTAPDAPAPTPEPAPAGDTAKPTTSAAEETGWEGLISATELDDEVKNIRNFLQENLQTVGNYNSAMLMIPPKAAALGVLAGVAMEHPGNISWKEDAIYIRDLAKQMNSGAALQRGAKDQKRLLALYEAVSDTLNRSKPAGLAEPPASDSFAEISEMRLVMMRMEEAEKKMRTEAGSEGSFSSNKVMVQHEASLLATMCHTVTLPGYGYEDDKEFVGFGQTIVEAAKSIMVSSEANDFASYELSLSKIATTCQSCHSKYKND